MQLLTNARAWLRATPYWSEDEQEAIVREWCAASSVPVVVYRESKLGREKWLKSIRETDAAVLPRLDIIVNRDGTRRPSVDLTITLDQLRAKAALVVDVSAGATSVDGKRWTDAIEAAMRRVTAGGGRKLHGKPGREMARKSADLRTARSLVAQWTDDNPPARKRLKHWRAVWMSRDFANADEAKRAMPEELQSLSRRSLERIFGGRTGRKR